MGQSGRIQVVFRQGVLYAQRDMNMTKTGNDVEDRVKKPAPFSQDMRQCD